MTNQMHQIRYPLELSFKFFALAPQIRLTDANGQLLMYIQEKFFALRENITVFKDQNRDQKLYSIKADRIIDFSACYRISDRSDANVGLIRRQGMRSLWKATYEICNAQDMNVGVLHEENPWIKVLDTFLSEIPFLNMLVNPSYLVEYKGNTVLRLVKKPSLFEKHFTIEKVGSIPEKDEILLILSCIMTTFLERDRG